MAESQKFDEFSIDPQHSFRPVDFLIQIALTIATLSHLIVLLCIIGLVDRLSD